MVRLRKPSAAFGVLAPFALCILLTAAATAFVGYSEREAEMGRFASAVIAARELIKVRMASYDGLLHGSAGVSRLELVSNEDFRVFVDDLRLSENFPGTLGVGYSAYFGAVSVSEAAARAHASGWTDVYVRPDTPREEVHAIVLIEPRSERNVAALGYDMHTDPTCREAMDRARDEGDVALSGKVTLVQEIDSKKQAGFALYLPVYEGGVIPPTVEERRAKLKAFIFAPLRAGDLFEGVFGHEKPAVSLELYDGQTPSASSLLFAFGPPIGARQDVDVQALEISGHAWTARFARSNSKQAFPRALTVAAFGLVLSLVVLVTTRGREKARSREWSAKASATASQEMMRFTELFVGILGHDLRSPLGAISLGCEVLLKDPAGDEKTKKIVSRILASSQRMGRMIDQILDLTRARLGGRLPVVPKPTDLYFVVKDVVGEVAQARPECRVEFDVSGDLHGEWDPDRLAQVTSNLVGNAVAHSEDAPVQVELRGTERERVVLKVHNAGVIPASLLPALFEPFRTAEQEARPSGLGLGLYITRVIVEAHKGTVEVTSAEGQGTTFTVVLPRGVPVSEPSPGRKPRRRRARREGSPVPT
ncbi:MAG TPA: CHASE domain-containing protein [Polyangiaceae bacterium]|nr:CHASE domain-containing protein [Polyangiaceae bacterium]